VSSTASRCPLCGAESRYALTASDRNRELTPDRFIYNRCVACESVFLIDVPADLSRSYEGAYHGFGADGEPEWRENPTLLAVEQFRARLLRDHLDGGALIDVGAGAGGFVAAASAVGFDASAIEMDARCCAYMRERLGVRAVCSDQPIDALRALPPARVITLWHSLEHLRNPAEMLDAAAERLQPGGVLAIGVPNPASLQFRLLGKRWAHLDAPRHLCLMPEPALVERLQKLGLRRVAAMTDDPFGVICSIHGWTYALRRRPARSPTPTVLNHAGRQLARALAPVEHAHRRGPALTLLAIKDG
jgi:SAM-dependent methyltransferase